MDRFRDMFNRLMSTPNKPEDSEDSSQPPTGQPGLSEVDENAPASSDSETITYPGVKSDAPPEPPRYIPEGVTRPLPPEPSMPLVARGGHITFGQTSDPGLVRSNNQDSALSFYFVNDSVDDRPDFGCFVIADGMGGHHDGEKASALTARIVAAEVLSNIYMPMLSGPNSHDADRPTIAEALTEAVKQANNKVLQDVPDGGTTLTAMVILGDIAHIAHVGDSRAYLINKGTIEQITRDHSLVQRLIELNQLTLEESVDHPQRNVLYRAIGQSTDLEVDTLTKRLPARATVLMCSDGLWGLVEEHEILDAVTSTLDPQEACDKLITIANSRGGHDNITVVLLKMPSH